MSPPFPSSPHVRAPVSVTRVMLLVCAALLPGVAAYVYFFGWGVLVNVALAVTVAVAAEAALLRVRKKPVWPSISDSSALLTAVLLGLTLPPLLPWWMTVTGTLFAIIVAKQLYGGLGTNPFNPAMVGYAVLLISFPREMTTWFAPESLIGTQALPPWDAARVIFTGTFPASTTLDSLATATPLDQVKTQLALGKSYAEITAENPLYGVLAGRGWEWVNGGFLLGGLWLIHKRIISWHIPVGFLTALLIAATLTTLFSSTGSPAPAFHLFSGATMLGAFFIATDPVTSATTPRGKLIFGAGAGLLVYVIRTWGGYPDAIAFAVLIMNMFAPTLDRYTAPRVYGHGA